MQLLSVNPTLNPDSLRNGIYIANNVWDQRPWAKEYGKDIFMNYILPPQVADEPVEYYWRTDIPKWIGIEYKGEELLEFARLINSKIDVDTRPEDWGNDQMGYTATMSGKFGKCDDRTILTTMAMRSMGVPAAFGMIPMWGSGNNGHSFCNVIASNGSTYAFQNKEDDGIKTHFIHKVPKIYQLAFFSNTDAPTYKQKGSEDIPALFIDNRLDDITHHYPIGFRDVSIKSQIKTGNKLCYLAVFTPNGWFPIAHGYMNGNDMLFHNIGTGTDTNGRISLKGENIGNGILYLPIICDNGDTPSSYPVIISNDGIRTLQPSNKTETITLSRKYPKLERISMFANRMVWGIIEVAEKADFSDAIQVHHIYCRPFSRMQKIHLDKEMKFRYIRFRKPTGPFSIAELRAYDKLGKVIPGTQISCDILSGEPDVRNINDNNPLTFFDISNSLNLWVGIDLGKSVNVSSFGFCPRNDDNEISPGDIYELLYWDNDWKSLGKKKAENYQLAFENVPKNALLWLRNKTKGREERPFTYDNNTQIWW